MTADRPDTFAVASVVTSDPIEIDAPAALVWGILADLARYGEWNPFCVHAVSTLEIGAAVTMRLVDYTGSGQLATNVEYVCAVEPGRLLAWELPDDPAWPYPARRDQIVEPLAADRCRYVSTDAFYGPNGIHVMRFCGSWVRRAFNDTAVALKARAEALYAATAD